jgi:hypothetical protein
MTDKHRYISLIRTYYQGCNNADAALMKTTFCDDVVHYFTHHPKISGAENLANYWVKMQPRIKGEWHLDHALVDGTECVIEWTMVWQSPVGERELIRGAEWYEFRDDKISEIRAYYLNRHIPYDRANFELDEFPYKKRNYAS